MTSSSLTTSLLPSAIGEIGGAYPQRLWAKATALVSAMWGAGRLAGPAIGGLFAQFGVWRLAFVLLAALALVIALIVPRALPRAEATAGSEPVPLVSLALLTAATAMISLASLRTDPLQIGGLIVVGLLLVVGFAAWERRATTRVLPATTYTSASPLKWSDLAVAIVATGTVTEAFTPLFGQRLAGLEPLVAGFLGRRSRSAGRSRCSGARTPPAPPRCAACGSPARSSSQPGSRSPPPSSRSTRGPCSSSCGRWGLVVAGAGIGIAFPHQVVAVMGSTPDEEEAGRATAGINTVELMALTFGSAVGGVLVNLGAPVVLDSARYLFWGFAAIALLGGLFARRSEPR
ncbi:MAG TPA: MFS transporter [Pseudonocardia sp.]|nr:MFS transporter [Pseudonocardia sp.]